MGGYKLSYTTGGYKAIHYGWWIQTFIGVHEHLGDEEEHEVPAIQVEQDLVG